MGDGKFSTFLEWGLLCTGAGFKVINLLSFLTWLTLVVLNTCRAFYMILAMAHDFNFSPAVMCGHPYLRIGSFFCPSAIFLGVT